MTPEQRAEIIRWALYEPMEWQKHGKAGIDMARCRREVYDRMSMHFYQCSRQKALEIDGYGFCAQHGKKLKRKLGELT